MATQLQDVGANRAPGYLVVPEETWWRLRERFQTKGQPKPFNEDYLMGAEIRADPRSARNILRPFKRMGLFKEDGQPTDLYWSWVDNDTYHDACQQILRNVYPEQIIAEFTSTDENERERLVRWFQRKQNVKPEVGRQYTRTYMLLLEGDASKQKEALTPPSSKKAKLSQSAASGAHLRRQAASAGVNVPTLASTPDAEAASTADGQEAELHRTPLRRIARSIEPSLNINVQIHIPVEASSEQIDQIFRSMAKHLYQQHDGE